MCVSVHLSVCPLSGTIQPFLVTSLLGETDTGNCDTDHHQCPLAFSPTFLPDRWVPRRTPLPHATNPELVKRCSTCPGKSSGSLLLVVTLAWALAVAGKLGRCPCPHCGNSLRRTETGQCSRGSTQAKTMAGKAADCRAEMLHSGTKLPICICLPLTLEGQGMLGR